MVFILNRFWYAASTIWPFIIIRKRDYSIHILNHEWIHWKQILYMGVLPAYAMYWIEFVIKLIYYRNPQKAYYAISFEREAHLFQEVIGYAQRRKPFTHFKFVYMADNPVFDYDTADDTFATLYDLPKGSVFKYTKNYESLLWRINEDVPEGKTFRVLPIIAGTAHYALYGPNAIMVIENTDAA